MAISSSSSNNKILWLAALLVLPLASYPVLGPAIRMFNKTFLMNPVETSLYHQKPHFRLEGHQRQHGKYRGRSALVVGGTKGVGWGTARALVLAGARRVTLVGRNDAAGAAAVARLQSEWRNRTVVVGYNEEYDHPEMPEITYLQGDISTVASTRRLLQKIQASITKTTETTMEEEEGEEDESEEEDTLEETEEEAEEDEEEEDSETEEYQEEHAEEEEEEEIHNEPTEPEYHQDEEVYDDDEEEELIDYYDFLIVSAMVFPNADNKDNKAITEDGWEPSFAVGVVGRFLLYWNAPHFLHPRRGRILNILAAGVDLGPMWPTLARQPSRAPLGLSLPLHLATTAHGNEIMLRRLLKERADYFHKRSVISTHPGIVATDLQKDWWFVKLVYPVVEHFYGTSVIDAGLQQAGILVSSSSSNTDNGDKQYVFKGRLTLIDNFGVPRQASSTLTADLKQHGDWLWESLLEMAHKMDQLEDA